MKEKFQFSPETENTRLSRYLSFVDTVEGYQDIQQVRYFLDCNKKDYQFFERWFFNYLQRPSYLHTDPFLILREFFNYHLLDKKNRGASLVEKLCQKFQWDFSLFSQWEQNIPPAQFAAQVSNTLRKMYHLEKNNPGSVNVLHDQFNIEYFGRYIGLDRQYREKDLVERPYGIVIAPKSDHNGAFSDLFLQINYKTIDALATCGVSTRTVECGTKQDLVEHIEKLDHKYGQHQKISFAMICGHGTEETITFAEHTPDGVLSKEDVKILFPPLKDFFSRHPTLVLCSCATGAGGGIAKQIADELNAFVWAPNKDTSIYDFSVNEDSFKDGSDYPILYARYYGEKSGNLFLPPDHYLASSLGGNKYE